MNPYELFCDDVFVGLINDPFDNDYTWYGWFESRLEVEKQLGKHILGFIEFSKDYNQKLENGEDTDESGFEKYEDLMDEYKWTVKTENDICIIDKAPNFYANEISWRLIEQN